jgi:hypothetical protein
MHNQYINPINICYRNKTPKADMREMNEVTHEIKLDIATKTNSDSDMNAA